MKETWDPEERAKRAKKCGNPKGFTMKQFCKNMKTRSKPGQKPNRLKETEMDTRPPAQQDYEDLLTTYSDVYKETYGYRPKFDTAMKFTSAQAVSDAIQDLYAQQGIQDMPHEPYHTEEFDASPEEFKPLPKMSGMKNRMALESFIRETLLSK